MEVSNTDDVPTYNLTPTTKKKTESNKLELRERKTKKKKEGGGCCGPKKVIKDEPDSDEDEEEFHSDNRRKYIFGLFVLFLFMGGIIPVLSDVHDWFMKQPFAIKWGLAATPHDRLMRFYETHEPKKATEKHVKGIVRKYRGRYDYLYQVLEHKYKLPKGSV